MEVPLLWQNLSQFGWPEESPTNTYNLEGVGEGKRTWDKGGGHDRNREDSHYIYIYIYIYKGMLYRL